MAENLELALAWLGLDQYFERFMNAGFDSWETLLEITEDDLEVLDVDLGHRRKLQREIQRSRATEVVQRTLATQQEHGTQQQVPTYLPHNNSSSFTAEPESLARESKIAMKRSYRHHPKPDPHAPKRPYSAYVLFSNHVRELLASENLEFPEISRQVGQRWQALSAQEKGTWKQQAQGPRDEYKEAVTRYRGTPEHLEHKQYLDDFQARQMGKNGRDVCSAIGSQTSPSGKGSMSSYPTPGPTSAGTAKTFSESYGSMASIEVPRSGMKGAGQSGGPDKKVAIQRLRGGAAKEVTENGDRKARSKQACEPCRQKKTKCNEERPTCGHCLELNIECHYSSGKENKEKRRFNELAEKLDACQKLLVHISPQLQSTEQALIQQTLNLPPDPSVTRISSQQVSYVDVRPHSAGNAESSDDDAPGLGLMEATCHVNDDDYAAEGMEMRPRAFAGQSSDVQWMRRLTNELNREGNGRRENQHPVSLSAQSNIFAEDNETAMVGDNVDPFQVPIKSTADALVDGYFRTVHASFPILHRSLFMQQYHKLETIWHKPVDFEDRMFITALQLVFAIGAVHARLSGSVEVSDDRDHMLYFARARLIAVDSGVFNDHVHLGQAQVFGLGAMYCLVTDQMNRAWVASGLAIRSAQSLGLHLQNITPSISKAEKDYRSRIWFALLSFERTLGVMSGRPSMVQDREYNLTLPTPENAHSASSSSQSEESYVASPKTGDTNSQTRGFSQNSMSEASHMSLPRGRMPNNTQSSLEATYFKYHVELSGLAHDAVSQLYSPAIRQYRWSKIQALIDDYDDHLTTWKMNLEPPFRDLTNDLASNLGQSPLGVALEIQFHCVRAIINRPCLYRRERTAFRQSSHVAVSRCISSARAVIDLVYTSPAAALIDHGPKWWLLLHHTKRALTVVLLELAFRAEHMPSEAEELLADAKKALAWLQKMAQTSKIAEHTWLTMSSLHVEAARRVGVDAGEGASLGNHTELPNGWLQHSDEDATDSLQHPMPAADLHQSQWRPPMPFGAATDSMSFGNFLPRNMDQVRPNQDPLAYLNFVEPDAFDQFSFEPMTMGRGDVHGFYDPYQPEFVGGPMHHPHSSFAIPHGSYSVGVPQLQSHQQQHKGSGVRADGYLTDDCFGFDPSRSS